MGVVLFPPHFPPPPPSLKNGDIVICRKGELGNKFHPFPSRGGVVCCLLPSAGDEGEGRDFSLFPSLSHTRVALQ